MKYQFPKNTWRLGLSGILAGVMIACLVVFFTPVMTLAQFDFQPPVDVMPTDYFYSSLESLDRNYGCADSMTYPDGTFRGNRQLTRNELAITLAVCMQQVERIIAESVVNPVTRTKVIELKHEIDRLQERVDSLKQARILHLFQ